MHPDVNTGDACFSRLLLLKMFSFASIEFTSFTRRTLQFGIQFEDAWNCSRGGGNVFSLDQVSAEHRLQLLCLLAPFPTFLRMDPEGGVGLLRGQENVLMGRRKLRGIFWRLGGIGENRVLLPVVNL